MRITVLAVGRLKPPWADDVEHYRRLLARHTRVETIEVREDEDVPRRVPPRAFLCLLDRTGDEMSSEQFASWLEQRRQSGRDLCFVVGGAFGLSMPACDARLSFGKLTFPHQMARVMLLEQLYRGHKILAGEPYHY